jgi:predicted nucleotide-binding protein (sugar kinase/HSP70/actin superfamily)
MDGIFASDVLGKTLRLIRPIAVHREDAEKTYYRLFRRLVEIIERPGKSLFAILRKRAEIDRLMKEAAVEFAEVKTDPARKVADVGMFGEIYVRNERFINENLIETLEQYGIRTTLVPVSEWLQYVNEESLVDYYREEERLFGKNPKGFAWLKRLWHRRKLIDPALRSWLAPARMARFASYFRDLWQGMDDPLIRDTLAAAQNRLPISVRGEAILSWGVARELQHSPRFAGIVNIGPFGCMPSKVVSVLLHDPEITKPVYDANYDGSRVNSRDIRVETFAGQVWDYVNGRSPTAAKAAHTAGVEKLSVSADD